MRRGQILLDEAGQEHVTAHVDILAKRQSLCLILLWFICLAGIVADGPPFTDLEAGGSKYMCLETIWLVQEAGMVRHVPRQSRKESYRISQFVPDVVRFFVRCLRWLIDGVKLHDQRVQSDNL